MTPLAGIDEGEFIAAVQASRALHQPWIAPPATPAAFQMLLNRTASGEVVSLVARRRDTNALVGYLNISGIIRGPLQSAFLGYGAFAGHVGQGLMTEAMALALGHTFGPMKLHRIEANIQPGNTRSIALARRSGFVREGFSERYLKVGGRWCDHERWAIRAEQWRERPASPR